MDDRAVVSLILISSGSRAPRQRQPHFLSTSSLRKPQWPQDVSFACGDFTCDTPRWRSRSRSMLTDGQCLRASQVGAAPCKLVACFLRCFTNGKQGQEPPGRAKDREQDSLPLLVHTTQEVTPVWSLPYCGESREITA